MCIRDRLRKALFFGCRLLLSFQGEDTPILVVRTICAFRQAICSHGIINKRQISFFIFSVFLLFMFFTRYWSGYAKQDTCIGENRDIRLYKWKLYPLLKTHKKGGRPVFGRVKPVTGTNPETGIGLCPPDAFIILILPCIIQPEFSRSRQGMKISLSLIHI